jgi:branched-chain amino acid transport system permease protein
MAGQLGDSDLAEGTALGRRGRYSAPPALALLARRGLTVWRSRRTGPVVKLLAAAVGVPLLITLAFGAVPFGVYLYGLVVGSLYALVAFGLILVYRANRIINFAQGALGAVPAITGILLLANRNWPYPVCVLIVLVGAPVTGALVEVVFVRRFLRSPRVILTLATIGVAQFLSFFVFILAVRWIPAQANQGFSINTPFSGHHVVVGGVNFTADSLVTMIIVGAAGVGLTAFFRYTQVGLAVRAAAENSDRAQLIGVPVNRVRTVVWMIAGLLSAVAIFQRTVLLDQLPTASGAAGFSTTELLYGLAPAVVARMESFPIALAAGLAFGVIEQGTFYATRNTDVASAIVLPLVLVALLVQRSRLSRAEDTGVATWREVKEFRPIPAELRHLPEVQWSRWGLWAVVAGLVLLAPKLAGTGRTDVASTLMIYAIIGVSLVFLSGWGGQISLGQFAIAGIGGAVAGGLATNHGMGFLVCILLGGITGAALAVAIGIPALRLPGLFLGVTTLALSTNTEFFFLQTRYFPWLLPPESAHVTRPVLFGGRLNLQGDLAYYYACVFVLVLAVACARSIRSHRSGRVIIAARDNARAAQSFGINLTRTRLAAFAMSGFFAAVAGALFAYLESAIDPTFFTPDRSITVFAMAVIGGLTTVGGAVAGAVYVVGFDYFLPNYSLLATGAGMLLVLMFFPGGLAELGFTLRDSFLRTVANRRRVVVPSLVADVRVAEVEQEAQEQVVIEAAEQAAEDLQTAAVPVEAPAANGAGRRARTPARKKAGAVP